MEDKELYQQRLQAQLDEWKAEVDKLKARVAGADADVKLEMNRQIKAAESEIEEAEAKLSELSQAGEGAWQEIKERMESVGNSLKSLFTAPTSKFKE